MSDGSIEVRVSVKRNGKTYKGKLTITEAFVRTGSDNVRRSVSDYAERILSECLDKKPTLKVVREADGQDEDRAGR